MSPTTSTSIRHRRAWLAATSGPLARYRWSSLPAYAKGNGPDWLVTYRVLRTFELALDCRGSRAYAAWLEARAASAGGKIGEAALAAIRRGWYLGAESFKDRLLKPFNPAAGKSPSGRSRTGREIRDHGEKEAECMVRAGMQAPGMTSAQRTLAASPKSVPRKILLAGILRTHTHVSNGWIADRLFIFMGHPGSVSRMLSACRGNRHLAHESDKLERILFPAKETNPYTI